MMHKVFKHFGRFRRDDSGSMTIEFLFFFVFFVILLVTGVEIAYLNLRHAMLERGVDMVTREIRLATGDIPTYDQVRNRICEEATIVGACTGNLRLEMVQVNPRAFQTVAPDADCQNEKQEPRPVRNFVAGEDNELMLIRACLKYKPILPTTGLGKALHKDAEGYAQMVVTSAFVQEPR
jgi:hypothetical protein